MKIIAHRGASAYAPENTFVSFDLALELGTMDIELDVQLACDGGLVVIHDETLDRTTDGSGIVEERTSEDLLKLDAGSWFDPRFADERIPLLEHVFQRYAERAHLHVEIKGKGAGITRKITDAVRSSSIGGRNISLSSFNAERLSEAMALAPEIPRIWLVKELTDDVLAIASELQLAEISLQAVELNNDTVCAMRSHGFGVRAWSVQNVDLMQKMATLGIDAMTVNFPDLFGALQLEPGSS